MELLNAIWNLVLALVAVVVTLLQSLVPWLPLIAWVAFWLLAVNWAKLYPALMQRGGIVGVLLIGLMTILVWGVIAPPDGGQYALFGLQVSNFVGKTVFVTGLFVIGAMCGSVQLSGMVAPCCLFEEPVVEEEHGHGHDDHH
ncbi:MAG: hypothetical protein KDA90_11025 [Planctomycetaceae bacterium]|nr:hypothetical protein [Planctomycetaceae bacterium]